MTSFAFQLLVSVYVYYSPSRQKDTSLRSDYGRLVWIVMHTHRLYGYVYKVRHALINSNFKVHDNSRTVESHSHAFASFPIGLATETRDMPNCR